MPKLKEANICILGINYQWQKLYTLKTFSQQGCWFLFNALKEILVKEPTKNTSQVNSTSEERKLCHLGAVLANHTLLSFIHLLIHLATTYQVPVIWCS